MAITLANWISRADRYLAQWGGCVGLDADDKKEICGEAFDEFCRLAKPFYSRTITLMTPGVAAQTFSLLDETLWTVGGGNKRIVQLARVWNSQKTMVKATDQGFLNTGAVVRQEFTTPTATPQFWGMYSVKEMHFWPQVIPGSVFTCDGWYFPLTITTATSDGQVLPFEPEWMVTLAKGLAARFIDAESRSDLVETYARLKAEYDEGIRAIAREYGNLHGGPQMNPMREVVSF